MTDLQQTAAEAWPPGSHQPEPIPGRPLLVLRQISKIYRQGSETVHALRSVDLEVAAGEFVAVTGKSGCGKSTLLHIIGGLENPTAGSFFFQGLEVNRFTEAQLLAYRRQQVGLVFQSFNLLPLLTLLENVALPRILLGESPRQARDRAAALLAQVDLSHRQDYKPHQVSGGEMQRAAIARALVNQPALLLADEPTGNLDSFHADQVLSLFNRLRQQDRLTIIMVTHSPEAARYADRILKMHDGRIL